MQVLSLCVCIIKVHYYVTCILFTMSYLIQSRVYNEVTVIHRVYDYGFNRYNGILKIIMYMMMGYMV